MFLISLCLLCGDDVSQKLQDVSVTVVTNTGSGSGVLKTRKRDEENITFIWTANHVVDGLRRTKTVVDPKTGTPKTIVEYADASVVQTLIENGRTIGKLSILAKVVKLSEKEDLALLQVRKKNFSTANVDFYLDEKNPPVGTQLFHVGSLLGLDGANSMTSGLLSQDGRLIDDIEFTQSSCGAWPGSSGGGMYMTDGRCIGLLTRGTGETFNLFVPVRRMLRWAKANNLEWALNDNIPLPSDEELNKIAAEDIGVNFEPLKTVPTSELSKYPTMDLKKDINDNIMFYPKWRS